MGRNKVEKYIQNAFGYKLFFKTPWGLWGALGLVEKHKSPYNYTIYNYLGSDFLD